jgi:hypothetical protein
MEWILIALLGGGGAYAARKLSTARAERAQRAEELTDVRRMADEDVTVFGEELQRLDAQVHPDRLDEPTRADYQKALDAYESAKQSVDRLREADEVSAVVDTLATGRYAMACVQARVEGRPVPDLRPPCYFNPQHGPSVTDVVWTRPKGGGTRSVPACAQDAGRVAAREKPDLRLVRIGSRQVPWWEAGETAGPYGRGYFPASVLAAAAGHQRGGVGHPGPVTATPSETGGVGTAAEMGDGNGP